MVAGESLLGVLAGDLIWLFWLCWLLPLEGLTLGVEQMVGDEVRLYLPSRPKSSLWWLCWSSLSRILCQKQIRIKALEYAKDLRVTRDLVELGELQLNFRIIWLSKTISVRELRVFCHWAQAANWKSLFTDRSHLGAHGKIMPHNNKRDRNTLSTFRYCFGSFILQEEDKENWEKWEHLASSRKGDDWTTGKKDTLFSV